MRAATSESFSMRVEDTATSKPSRASATAISAPMPCDAPVTKAVLRVMLLPLPGNGDEEPSDQGVPSPSIITIIHHLFSSLLLPLHPPWQRPTPREPCHDSRVRFERHFCIRRGLRIGEARDIGYRGPAEREPVVALQAALEG